MGIVNVFSVLFLCCSLVQPVYISNQLLFCFESIGLVSLLSDLSVHLVYCLGQFILLFTGYSDKTDTYTDGKKLFQLPVCIHYYFFSSIQYNVLLTSSGDKMNGFPTNETSQQFSISVVIIIGQVYLVYCSISINLLQ